jgi:hypothetical protein
MCCTSSACSLSLSNIFSRISSEIQLGATEKVRGKQMEQCSSSRSHAVRSAERLPSEDDQASGVEEKVGTVEGYESNSPHKFLS